MSRLDSLSQHSAQEEKRGTYFLTPAEAALLAFIFARTVAKVKGRAVQKLCAGEPPSQPLRGNKHVVPPERADSPTPSPNPARHPWRLACKLPMLLDLGFVWSRNCVVVAARQQPLMLARGVLEPQASAKRIARDREEHDLLPKDGIDAFRDGVGEFCGDDRVRVVVPGKLIVLRWEAEEHCRKTAVSERRLETPNDPQVSSLSDQIIGLSPCDRQISFTLRKCAVNCKKGVQSVLSLIRNLTREAGCGTAIKYKVGESAD